MKNKLFIYLLFILTIVASVNATPDVWTNLTQSWEVTNSFTNGVLVLPNSIVYTAVNNLNPSNYQVGKYNISLDSYDAYSLCLNGSQALTYDANNNLLFISTTTGKLSYINLTQGLNDTTCYFLTNFTSGVMFSIKYYPLLNGIFIGSAQGNLGFYNLSDNTLINLSGTDTGNWAGISDIRVLALDTVHGFVYTGMQSGKFGVYNISDNIWYNLNDTDENNFIGSQIISGAVYDSVDDVVYTSAGLGLFGRYNRSTNIMYNLSDVDTGNWFGTTAINTLEIANRSIYLGLASGKFGVYNINTNVAENLSDKDIGNWVGVTAVNSLSYDATNKRLYTALSSGKFGYYTEPCTENWVQQNTTCNGFNYTVQYNDTNMCGTFISLPIDNATLINCSFPCVENWTPYYVPLGCWFYPNGTETESPYFPNLNQSIYLLYNDTNSCGTTNNLPIENGTNDMCPYFYREYRTVIGNNVSFNFVSTYNGTITIQLYNSSNEQLISQPDIRCYNTYSCAGTFSNLPNGNYIFDQYINYIDYGNATIDATKLMSYTLQQEIPLFDTFNIGICTPDWVQNNTPCINDTYYINFDDVNSCGNIAGLPITNGTQLSCAQKPPYQINNPNTEVVIQILIFFVILSLLAGIGFMFFKNTEFVEKNLAIIIVGVIVLVMIFVLIAIFL